MRGRLESDSGGNVVAKRKRDEEVHGQQHRNSNIQNLSPIPFEDTLGNEAFSKEGYQKKSWTKTVWKIIKICKSPLTSHFFAF